MSNEADLLPKIFLYKNCRKKCEQVSPREREKKNTNLPGRKVNTLS